MGGGHSRTIAYKEALSKFDQDELGSLTKTFQALAKHAEPSTKIDKTTMKKHLYQLDELLQERYFASFVRRLKEGPGHSPMEDDLHFIDFQSYICTVAMCCKAVQDVKIQFIFELFDLQNTEKVSKDDFMKTMQSINTSALTMLECDLLLDKVDPKGSDDSQLDEKRSNIIKTIADSLFVSHTELQFKDFKPWIVGQPQITEFLEYVMRREFDPEGPIPFLLQKRATVTPLKLIGNSEVLTEELTKKFKDFLPLQFQKCNMVLLYGTKQHGYSLTTMLHYLQTKKRDIYNPTLLVCSDTNDYVFGAFAPELWRKYSRDCYGNENSFVFKLLPQTKVYPSPLRLLGVGKKEDPVMLNFMYSREEGISMGGTKDYHSLFLDEAFLYGSSYPTQTFGNEGLAKDAKFKIKTVEVWGFVDKEKSKFLMDDMEKEADPDKKSVLDNKENTFVLDLLGKNYSSMVRD